MGLKGGPNDFCFDPTYAHPSGPVNLGLKVTHHGYFLGIEPYLPSDHPPQKTIPHCPFHPSLPSFLLSSHHFFPSLDSTRSCKRVLETHLLPSTLLSTIHSFPLPDTPPHFVVAIPTRFVAQSSSTLPKC